MTRSGRMGPRLVRGDEYECHDDQRKPQGRAAAILNDWKDYAAGIVQEGFG